MTLYIWKSNDAPPGFTLGPPPQDFGVSRSAYLRDDQGNLRMVISRGGGYVKYHDGSIEEFPSYFGWSGQQLIQALKRAASEGFFVQEI